MHIGWKFSFCLFFFCQNLKFQKYSKCEQMERSKFRICDFCVQGFRVFEEISSKNRIFKFRNLRNLQKILEFSHRSCEIGHEHSFGKI